MEPSESSFDCNVVDFPVQSAREGMEEIYVSSKCVVADAPTELQDKGLEINASSQPSLIDSIKEHLSIAVPVTFTFLMRKSVDVVSVIFIGHLGATYLAAAGLATITQNVSGGAIIYGLTGALGTIAGQANGGKDYKELNLSIQRAALILTVFVCIPVSILWMNIGPVFHKFGLNDEVIKHSSHYLRILVPGLWFMAYAVCIQNWLHAQNVTKPTAIITMVTALCHPIICYLFIHHYNFGFLGAAMAVSFTKGLELSGGCIYLLFISTKFKETNFQLSNEAFTNWCYFLSLGVPNVLMMSEWMASEIVMFLSARLADPDIAVSSMSIYQSLLAVCFMVPMGFHVSALTIVGNALGAGQTHVAQSASKIAPILTLCVVLILAVLLLFFRDSIGQIFTNDREVISTVESLIPVIALYIVFDGLQATITGILKGMGRQQVCGPIVVFSYYAVGIPVSYYLAFIRDKGVFGLVCGTLTGTIVHFLLFFVILYLCTDWDRETLKVKERNRRSEFYSSVHTREILGEDAYEASISLDTVVPLWWEKLLMRLRNSIGFSSPEIEYELADFTSVESDDEDEDEGKYLV